jgi:hypothetical protein
VLLQPEPPHPLSARLLPFRVLRGQAGAGGHLLAGMFVPRLSDGEARSLAGA